MVSMSVSLRSKGEPANIWVIGLLGVGIALSYMHIYNILRKRRKTRGGEKSGGHELMEHPAWLDGGREVVGSPSSFCPSSGLKGP